MPKINLKGALDNGMSWRYAKCFFEICLRYVPNIQEVCLRYARGNAGICLRYDYMYLRFAQDPHKIRPKYT